MRGTQGRRRARDVAKKVVEGVADTFELLDALSAVVRVATYPIRLLLRVLSALDP